MSQLPPQPSHSPIDAQRSSLKRLRRLSYLLDDAIRIPGTPYRIGLDPLLDLLPIGGDFLGTAFSIYIIVEAARLGVPRSVLVQMVGNIVFDTVIGIVPVLGALADATWKANTKNLELLEEQLKVPSQAKQRTNWLFLVLLLAGLLLVVMGVAAIGVIVLKWLLGVFTR